ncbi:MAG: HAMP domain-containing protein [Gemmatimonadetes bacterium]|nr:HAMP domain-containing protein [Gemmatimonadota bacterium]
MPRIVSFRTRILLVVLAGALIPLALVGLWLTRTAARSGEELLEARVSEALDRTVAEIGARWIRLRSDLLLLAEDDAVQRALAATEAVPTERSLGSREAGRAATPQPASLDSLFTILDRAVERAVVRDNAERILWSLDRSAAASASFGSGDPLLSVRLNIYERASGRALGLLEAGVRVSALTGDRLGSLAAAGAVLGAFDRGSGAALLPLPFDPAAVAGERFLWTGDEWITQRRTLEELPLELVAAAPLGPFTRPFEQAARRGVWALLIVAAVGLTLAAALTGRMTRSLERLATAAEAVSRGDLERKVESGGEDEVGRVARSFNAMTDSLRRTLRQLSQREALAAVGEFASTLAHEIRNPLTSIRVDLQMVEEALPKGSELRQLQSGALEEIARLDRTVSGALVVARSGRITLRPLDLQQPLRAALHAAQPAFAVRGALLEPLAGNAESIHVEGDAGALEQLFLNILLNAAQALGSGGCARAHVRTQDDEAVVAISDNGRGIPPDVLEHVFEPFFSTRPDGTGLGLAVAQRIAAAHHGEVRVDSRSGEGTTVEVRLPLAVRAPV